MTQARLLQRINNLPWPTKIGGVLSAATLASFVAIGITQWDQSEPSHTPQQDTATASQDFQDVVPPVIIEEQFTEAALAIEDAVQEALTQPIEPTSTATTSDIDTTVDGLQIDSSGEIYYHDWIIPPDVYEADVQTSTITGLPLSYMLAVQSLESSFDPNAFNSIKACGLSQFVPSTLAEKAYKYADLIGYEGVRDTLVERTVDRRDDKGRPYYAYDYVDTLSQHTLVDACWDPAFNTRLAAIMQIQDIGRLQSRFAEHAPAGMDYYPVTELHGYVAHFAGGNAGKNLLQDFLTNNGQSPAHTFFSAGAVANTTNQKLLFHPKTVIEIINGAEVEKIVPDQENPRTTAEFFEFLIEEKGLSDTPLPNFTDWSSTRTQISQNMADVAPTTVSRLSHMVYSPRPQLRSEHSAQIASLDNN